MSIVIVQPSAMKDRDVCGFFDDFHWYISPHLWTSLAADAGITAFAAGDTAAGVLSGSSGTSDNNELAVASTKKAFLLANDKPAFCEGRFQYSEANTSAMNFAFGFADAIGAADFLVDNGAGPKSSWSGAVIYKVDGGTVWRVRSSNGTTNTDNVTAITAGGTSFQRLRIEVSDYTTLAGQVTYWIDGQILRDSTTNLPIVHTVLYASLAQMQVGGYMKCGSTTSETLLMDYMAAYQAR